jgi:exo-beta-1,3-glucanase (GH17 family)
MSYRPEKQLSLQGIDLSNTSPEEFRDLFGSVLKMGMHGICFSPYEEGQAPGHILKEDLVRRRMEILRPYFKWVRSFSCVEGNEIIPRVAHEMDFKTLVGAWLGNDTEMNKKEIDGLISLAQEGLVDIAAVGNEVMYRGDLTEEELLAYINQVKKALPNIPVGYVDAYYEFSERPNITMACDVVLANCYPYWEGCHIDYSFLHVKQMYYQALHAGQGKKVIITETGWPSQGTGLDGAHPSKENALRYFINMQKWASEEEIEMFYFSSFDESWKVGAEGDVGAYWGLWDKNEKIKF